MNAMIDKNIPITDLVNEYRDCCCAIWNNHFMKRFNDCQEWGVVDCFNVIKEELFRGVVLVSELGNEVSNFSLGFPSKLITVMLLNRTPVQINRNKNAVNNADYSSAGYWDYPLTELDSRATLLFVDFFDWNPYGLLNMKLVMCEILENPDRPDVEGHRLLVDLDYVEIFLNS